MNDDDKKLFSAFELLKPSVAETTNAVERTRAAIAAATNPMARPIPSNTAQARTGQTNRRRRTRSLALVATLLVTAGIGWLTILDNSLAIADIVENMIQSRSFRVVSEFRTSIEEDKWGERSEVLFDQQHGFLSRHHHNGQVWRVELDDGEHHWTQSQPGAMVTRGKTRDVARTVSGIFDPLKTKELQPDPERDQELDGAKYHCFVATYDDKDSKLPSRVSVWVDQSGRLNRSEYEYKLNGDWIVAGRSSVEYELDFDSTTFKPNFGDSVKVVDYEKLFEEMFPLGDAIHRSEHSGYELAVHQLKRLGPLHYFVVASCRPTEETRRILKLKRGESAGEFHPSGRSRLLKPHGMENERAAAIATAQADGVQVWASVVSVSGSEPGVLQAPIQRARPCFGLYPHPKLWKHTGSHLKMTIDVRLPEQDSNPSEVVRAIYDQIATLESVPMDTLYLIDSNDKRVFTDTIQMGGGTTEIRSRNGQPRPSEIAFEKFLRDLQSKHKFLQPGRARAEFAKREKQWLQNYGPEDPLVFLEELQDPSVKPPTMWTSRVPTLLRRPDPTVQLAALKYCGEVISLHWVHALLDVAENEEDANVKAAANRTLDLYRRPVAESGPIEKGEAKDDLPTAELDLELVDLQIQQLLKMEDIQTVVTKLRDHTGLNYGDGQSEKSRMNWSQWWEHERASVAAAANGNREFVIYGKTTDLEGNSLPHAPVEVTLNQSLNGGSKHQRAAYTLADDDGCYILRFGFVQQEPEGLPVVQRRFGSPNPGKPENGLGWGYASRYEFDDDPVTSHSKSRFVFTGRPKKAHLRINTKLVD